MEGVAYEVRKKRDGSTFLSTALFFSMWYFFINGRRAVKYGDMNMIKSDYVCWIIGFCLLTGCPRLVPAAQTLYSVGAGSLEETLDLYSQLTGVRVENCVWGILHPFELEVDDAQNKQRAIASLSTQFEQQNIRLVHIAEGRKVAVWNAPKTIKKMHVGDLCRFYALVTGKRVDLVQGVQFWVDLPKAGIPRGDAAKWVEQQFRENDANIFQLNDGHVVVAEK